MFGAEENELAREDLRDLRRASASKLASLVFHVPCLVKRLLGK